MKIEMLPHVWGLIAHPRREWQQIHGERETLTHLYARHVMALAAIPAICAYIGTTQIGWSLSGDHAIQLTLANGLFAGIVFYVVMLAAVFVVGSVLYRAAQSYSERPDLRSCVVFAGYVATPMFLSGIVALYPLVWLCLLVGFIGFCYSAFLLYLGVPAFLGVGRRESYSVAHITLAVGVLVLEGLLAAAVLLWGYGRMLLT